MGKIVYLMGKSSTGKDTIYKHLTDNSKIKLHTIVPYTTRPIRAGETDGVEYFFTDEAGFLKLKEEGRLIEDRAYNTCLGLWRYFTVNDGQIDLEHKDYVIIGTLESYKKTKEFFGEEKMVPVMIELDDGVRLQRALDREKAQDIPKYNELCRRFLADAEDFSVDKIEAAGISKRFVNNDLQQCVEEIMVYLSEKL